MQKIKVSLLVAICLFVAACGSPAIITDLQTYRQQLENALDHSFSPVQTNISLFYPKADSLRVQVPTTTISLREFYALEQCPVYTLIAQRNTVLGKVQLPSVRFIYEHQLITGLGSCLALVTDEQQIQQLQGWIQVKKQGFPLVWAHMIQTSTEVKKTFSSNQSLFTDSDPQGIQKYLQALNYLLAISTSTDADPNRLENALNTLRLDPVAAKLWRTQRLISQNLRHISQQLTATFTKLDCQTEQTKQQAITFFNIYNTFFIVHIQPFIKQLDQVHSTISPSIQQLQENSHLAVEFTDYLAEQSAESGRYQNAIKEHVSVWQELGKLCDITFTKSV